MIRDAGERKQELVRGLLEEAKERLGQAEGAAVGTFIRLYYDRVPPGDIAERGQDQLFGAALAHWRFGARYEPGQAKVRIYNPNLEEHGWKSDHTVIEMVNDDMPFLVDSVAAELSRRDISIHLIVHPILAVRREAGAIAEILEPGSSGDGVTAESFMHIEISRQSAAHLPEIAAALERVLADVRVAVTDWQALRAKVLEAAADFQAAPGPVADEDRDEICAFLRWIHDNNFTLLGYRRFDFEGGGRKTKVTFDPDAGLGLLRDPGFQPFGEFADLQNLRPEVREFLSRPEPLVIAKTDVLSMVHRPVYMDSIAVRRFGSKGKVIGQHLFVGLFTSSAYNHNTREIPLLRRKIGRVLERADLPPNSHDSKALNNILENFPRDELFQVSEDHLLNTGLGILNLQERQRVALFLRRDDLERFMSCLVYVPRDRYDTDFRRRVQGIMEDAFDGECGDWYTQLGDAPLARTHMFIRTKPGTIPDYDADAIEADIVQAARSWADQLQDALVSAHGEELGLALYRRYTRAFRSGYRERFNGEVAVGDIDMIEQTLADGGIGMSLRRTLEAGEHQVRFKLYHPDSPIPLSDALPMLEHMGLKVVDEVPFPVTFDNGGLVMIHDFGLETRDGRPIDLSAVRGKFQEAFRRVWGGEVESDGFNGLVVRAGLGWREVVILRAYCKYLRQAGITYSNA